MATARESLTAKKNSILGFCFQNVSQFPESDEMGNQCRQFVLTNDEGATSFNLSGGQGDI